MIVVVVDRGTDDGEEELARVDERAAIRPIVTPPDRIVLLLCVCAYKSKIESVKCGEGQE